MREPDAVATAHNIYTTSIRTSSSSKMQADAKEQLADVDRACSTCSFCLLKAEALEQISARVCTYESSMCTYAAGSLSAEASELYGGVLTAPNRELVLMEMFQDPAKLKDYMQTNCQDALITPSGAESVSAAFYAQVVFDDLEDLDDDAVLKICTDKAGAWKDYHLCAATSLICSVDVLHLHRFETLNPWGCVPYLAISGSARRPARSKGHAPCLNRYLEAT